MSNNAQRREREKSRSLHEARRGQRSNRVATAYEQGYFDSSPVFVAKKRRFEGLDTVDRAIKECKLKKRYQSKHEAVAAGRAATERERARFRIDVERAENGEIPFPVGSEENILIHSYRCPVCQAWHIGHMSNRITD